VKRLLLVSGALSLAAFLIAPSPEAVAAADQAPHAHVPPRVAGRFIVGAKAAHRSAAAASIHGQGGRIVSYYAPGDFYVVDSPSKSPDWASTLRGAPGIRYAEPDFVVSAEDVTPEDPMWTSQWGPQKIGAPLAWESSTGSGAVVVGVIDSGVDYSHDDLATQIWTNPNEIPSDGIDNDGNGYVDDVHGADCRNDDGDPMDDYFHGTHVAGILGAAGDNAVGIAGVNWHISIMALKFLGPTGSGSVTDAIECIDYAVANGAALTNNSWGGAPYSQALSDAIGRARAAGQPFVAAAGNNGANTDLTAPFYPADYSLDNIVSVASIDSTDTLGSTSNFGALTVDLAAPGVEILSTMPGNAYASFSGTSMAAPHVAGAAALVLAEHPELTYQQVIDRLDGSVDRITSLSGKVATGGRLNIARAIESDTVSPGPLALAVKSSSRNSVTLKWNAPGDDGVSGGPVASYLLRYASAGSTQSTAPAPIPAMPGTVQQATVSGLRPSTSYAFTLLAKDNVGNAATSTVTGKTGPGTEIFFDDMESGPSKWTSTSPWSITSEQSHSPTSAWSDSPSGPYANGRDISLLTQSFGLTGVSNPSVSFWQRRQLEQNRDFGYVYVSTNGGSTWTQLAKYTGASDYAPTTISLAPYLGSANVRLRFRLTSDGVVVSDGWYVDDVLVTVDDSFPPTPPQNLLATPGDGQVALDWADNPEADLASYSVQRTTDPPGASRTWASISTVTASNYTDTGLTNNTIYYYQVTAKDAAGNLSGPSEEVLAAPTDATPPTPPQSLLATPGDAQVALDWADNPEADLASYSVQRTTDPPGASTRTWAPISSVTASNYIDTGLTNDTIYYYRVTATDAAGNQSGPSDEASATPDADVVAYTPTTVTISTGTPFGDPIGNLSLSDDQDFRVNAATSGAKRAVQWIGSATVEPANATKLTFTYEGAWSGSGTQKLAVRNFATGTWETISTQPISTADALFTWFTTQPGNYVSAAGQVQMRVNISEKTSLPATCRADLMLFTIEY
jgi:subtilisin family serine protease